MIMSASFPTSNEPTELKMPRSLAPDLVAERRTYQGRLFVSVSPNPIAVYNLVRRHSSLREEPHLSMVIESLRWLTMGPHAYNQTHLHHLVDGYGAIKQLIR